MASVNIAKILDRASGILPYIAEVGRAAYASLCVVILAVAGAEFLMPGLMANFVAPQALVASAVLAGGLSLVSAPRPSRAFSRLIVYSAAGAAATTVAFSASWYYFATVPEAQAPLAYAFGLVVALMFLAYARTAHEEENA